MLKITLYLFVLLSVKAYSQTVENMSPQQIKGDVEFMIHSIEDISVNPYFKISKGKFVKQIKLAEQDILKKPEVNSIDFYKVFQPVIVKLQDGHTVLNIYDFLAETDYLIFPFVIDISENSLFIKSIKIGYKETIHQNLVGREIKNINGQTSKQILKLFSNYTSGESKRSRIALSKYYFNNYYNLFLTKGKELSISLDNNEEFKIHVLKKSERIVKPQNNEIGKNFSFGINKNYAVLNFKSFSDLEGFKTFLKNMFSDLKENNIKNLIIDIRDNSGGNSELGDELFKYLLSEPYSQYQKTIVKYRGTHKQTLKNKTNTEDEAVQTTLQKPSGDIETINKSLSLTNPKEASERFNGNVYLLISGQTFSSASDFANAFKYYKAGSVIGEETGGFVVSPGEIVEIQLPNSKLFFNLSSTKDFGIGTTEKDWHGVIPDFRVLSKDALDFTLTKFIK